MSTKNPKNHSSKNVTRTDHHHHHHQPEFSSIITNNSLTTSVSDKNTTINDDDYNNHSNDDQNENSIDSPISIINQSQQQQQQQRSSSTQSFSSSTSSNHDREKMMMMKRPYHFSLRLVIVIFFSVILILAWTLPIVILFQRADSNIQNLVSILGSEVSNLIRTTLEERLARGIYSLQSLKNSSSEVDDEFFPYSSNTTRHVFFSRFTQSAFLSSGQYWPEFSIRFIDGTEAVAVRTGDDIQQFQLCRSNDSFYSSMTNDNNNNGFGTQRDCDVLLFNRTTLIPLDKDEYADRYASLYPSQPGTFVNSNLWNLTASLAENNRKMGKPGGNRSVVQIPPYMGIFPEAGVRKVRLTFLATQMTSGYYMDSMKEEFVLLSITSQLSSNLNPQLREFLPPAPLARAYLTTIPNENRAIAASHGDIITNVTFKNSAEFRVDENCLTNPDTPLTAYCFYNISDHPEYFLLRGEYSQDDYISDELEIDFLSSKATLHVFLPTDFYLGPVQDARTIALIVDCIFVLLGCVVTFFIVRLALRRVEKLADDMNEDPFERSKKIVQERKQEEEQLRQQQRAEGSNNKNNNNKNNNDDSVNSHHTNSSSSDLHSDSWSSFMHLEEVEEMEIAFAELSVMIERLSSFMPVREMMTTKKRKLVVFFDDDETTKISGGNSNSKSHEEEDGNNNNSKGRKRNNNKNKTAKNNNNNKKPAPSSALMSDSRASSNSHKKVKFQEEEQQQSSLELNNKNNDEPPPLASPAAAITHHEYDNIAETPIPENDNDDDAGNHHNYDSNNDTITDDSDDESEFSSSSQDGSSSEEYSMNDEEQETNAMKVATLAKNNNNNSKSHPKIRNNQITVSTFPATTTSAKKNTNNNDNNTKNKNNNSHKKSGGDGATFSKCLIAYVYFFGPPQEETTSNNDKTQHLARNTRLLDRADFINSTIMTDLIEPTGASLVEYRNDIFILTLRMSRRSRRSKLASRFCKKMVEVAEKISSSPFQKDYNVGPKKNVCMSASIVVDPSARFLHLSSSNSSSNYSNREDNPRQESSSSAPILRPVTVLSEWIGLSVLFERANREVLTSSGMVSSSSSSSSSAPQTSSSLSKRDPPQQQLQNIRQNSSRTQQHSRTRASHPRPRQIVNLPSTKSSTADDFNGAAEEEVLKADQGNDNDILTSPLLPTYQDQLQHLCSYRKTAAAFPNLQFLAHCSIVIPKSHLAHFSDVVQDPLLEKLCDEDFTENSASSKEFRSSNDENVVNDDENYNELVAQINSNTNKNNQWDKAQTSTEEETTITIVANNSNITAATSATLEGKLTHTSFLERFARFIYGSFAVVGNNKFSPTLNSSLSSPLSSNKASVERMIRSRRKKNNNINNNISRSSPRVAVVENGNNTGTSIRNGGVITIAKSGSNNENKKTVLPKPPLTLTEIEWIRDYELQNVYKVAE